MRVSLLSQQLSGFMKKFHLDLAERILALRIFAKSKENAFSNFIISLFFLPYALNEITNTAILSLKMYELKLKIKIYVMNKSYSINFNY